MNIHNPAVVFFAAFCTGFTVTFLFITGLIAIIKRMEK